MASVAAVRPVARRAFAPHPRPAGSTERFACAEATRRRYGAAGEAEAAGLPRVERAARRADALALGLRAALDRIATPLARSAAALVAAAGWREFGYARLADHARERFGRSARWVRDLARLGTAQRDLPDLEAALTGADGGRPIGRAAAVLLAGVADPRSLAAWLAVARTATCRELRAAVAAARDSGSSWPPAAEPSVACPPADGSAAGPPGQRFADPADLAVVRLPVPAPVLGAFDECLDLHRAVEGREATVASFVECLVAELESGGEPAVSSADGAGGSSFSPSGTCPAGMAPTGGWPAAGAVERALARSTGRWRHLDAAAGHAPAASPAAARALARLGRLEAEAGIGDARRLDAQLRALIALEDELEVHLGRLLADMGESGAWTRLRFAGVGHYAEERLGLARSAGEDRARAARLLRTRPRLRAAYESGRVGLEAALTVARILAAASVDETVERAWVERAAQATLKRLRDEARAIGRRRAFAGADAGPPGAVIAGAAGDPAPVAGVPARVAAAPAPLADAEWHASLRRAPGTARRRVLRLGFATLDGGAARSGDGPGGRLDPAVCVPSIPDVFLRLRLPEDGAADFLRALETARRALEARAAAVPWDQPWPEPAALPSVLVARTFSIRGRRVPVWVALLRALEEFALTWDASGPWSGRPPDPVMVRDGWRCAAPGCMSRRNLEDHHLKYRSRGGQDEPANRVCLCRFHHQRGEHGGLTACTGRAPLGVVWRLGRDGAGGAFRNERRIAAGAGAASPPERARRRRRPARSCHDPRP